MERVAEHPSRLAFIDGLRGLAAFIVMAGHAIAMVPHGLADVSTFERATWLQRLLWPCFFGAQMVYLFIFVSGFSLYYSERRRALSGQRFDLREYARRRFLRIAPTYYVTLAISLFMVAAFPSMRVHTGTAMDSITPVTASSVVAHLFFVHNFSPEWTHKINAPLWSIATEVQLYLIFPLVCWAMRRFNVILAAGGAIFLQLAIQHFLPFPFFTLMTYFGGGMLLAHLAMAAQSPPFRAIGGGALAVILYAAWRGPVESGYLFNAIWLIGFAGLVFTLFFAPSNAWYNVPAWKPIRFIGSFSYSIYVVHFPLIFLLYTSVFMALPWSPELKGIGMLIAGLPLACVAAWLMYRRVERWSLDRIRRPAPAVRSFVGP